MKYSLLFKERRSFDASAAAADLSVERVVRSFCSDPDAAAYLTKVISAPPEKVDDVLFRREVAADLAADPSLIGALAKCCARFDRMKDDWAQVREHCLRRDFRASAETALEGALAALREAAMFPSTLQSLLRDVADTLDNSAVSSEGLVRLRSGARSVSSDEALGKVAGIAERFRFASSEKSAFALSCSVDEFLRVRGADVFDVAEADGSRRRSRKKSGPLCSFEGDVTDDAAFLAAAAAGDLCALISDIVDSVYGAFYGLSKELLFYDGALEYTNYLTSSGLGCATPEILPEEAMTVCVRGLRDLYLAADGMAAKDIVPFDAALGPDTDGMIIRGENGAGKTTFLRAVGLAQLFAQAGLPLPCESARLSVRSGIFTQFSSAEEEFRPGDAAGRFEAEAREIAGILDDLRPHSLLLLNETFQTTSFEEGTRGIRAILGALPNVPAQYIFVTHLTSLFDRRDPGATYAEFDLKKHNYTKLEDYNEKDAD